jgi:hypothetical protein
MNILDQSNIVPESSHELSLTTRNRGTQTQLKDGDMVFKLNSKNISTTVFLCVRTFLCERVRKEFLLVGRRV